MKCGALVGRRIGPDPSAMPMHYSLDDGQTDTSAFEFLRAM